MSIRHTSPPSNHNEGVNICFILKEFAAKNKIEFNDLISKPISISLEIETNEFIRSSSRQIVKLSQYKKCIAAILLESYNKISVSFEGSKILTKSHLNPGIKSNLELTFYETILSIVLNGKTIAQHVYNTKAISYLEKSMITFGGHGPNQKYEHELFKGLLYEANVIFPAIPATSEIAAIPLNTLRLCTEHEAIDTIEDLYNYDPGQFPHLNPSLVPLRHRGSSLKKNPRSVLICHDSQADVTEDIHIYGDKKTDYAYRFRFWQNIDDVCYVNHHLVVIPPPGYITVAHREGVKILGAFITEPGKGEHFNNLVIRNLSPDGSMKLEPDFFYANKLVDICKTHGFDGYLMNIEADVESDLIPNLIAWLQYFRFKLKEAVPHAEVVWYDSILESGKVRWQSMINKYNAVFLDVSDKFFTDYHWKLEHLKISVETAKERSLDIMFGNDVYGRGTYGGGKLNTYMAIDEIMKYPLSISIFGQAYYYQNGMTSY